MPTDTSEKGFETRVCILLEESDWLLGSSQDYDPTACADLAHLAAFLQDTQPETAQALNLDADTNTRQRFLRRLHREIGSRGIIDILRNGIDHGQHSVRLFYGTPSPGNQAAADLHARNRFSVTRQVHYSPRNPSLSLDLTLFINGPTGHHLRAQEQPDQADRGGRGRAVQAGQRPPRGPVPARALRRPLGGRREPGEASARSWRVRPPSSCLSTGGTTAEPAILRTHRGCGQTTSGRKP